MMVRTLVVAVLAGGLLAVPGGTTAARPQDKAGKTPADAKPAPAAGAARIVSLLQTGRVTDYPKDLQQTPFPEVLNDLGRRFEVTILVSKTAFENPAALDDAKGSNLSAPRLDGLTLHAYLTAYLRGLSVPDATYLVRDDYIEITSLSAARKEAGLDEAMEAVGEDAAEAARVRARLTLPLVCVAADDAKLADVVRTLARVYGLNVTVDKAAQEAAGQAVLTERLLNVPADTALELLAGQAGLEVVRKGNTFRLGGGGGA